MMKKIFIGMLLFTILLISGCSNKELDQIHAEKEQLTSVISQLNKIITEKDEEISSLEEDYSNNITELGELTKSLEMVRWSSIARLDDYNNSFYDLEEIYKIHSNHAIEDDWYVINDEYFQIELLDYENAKKVDFYILRLESDEGISLVFTDTESTDGWIYTNDTISKIINKHKGLARGSTFIPYFVIYTEVTFEDGNVIRTSKLPIYNK